MIYLHAQSDILISVHLIQLFSCFFAKCEVCYFISDTAYTVQGRYASKINRSEDYCAIIFCSAFSSLFPLLLSLFSYKLLIACVFINNSFLGGVWEIDKLMIWIKNNFIEWMIYAAETWANSLNLQKHTKLHKLHKG